MPEISVVNCENKFCPAFFAGEPDARLQFSPTEVPAGPVNVVNTVDGSLVVMLFCAQDELALSNEVGSAYAFSPMA